MSVVCNSCFPTAIEFPQPVIGVYITGMRKISESQDALDAYKVWSNTSDLQPSNGVLPPHGSGYELEHYFECRIAGLIYHANCTGMLNDWASNDALVYMKSLTNDPANLVWVPKGVNASKTKYFGGAYLQQDTATRDLINYMNDVAPQFLERVRRRHQEVLAYQPEYANTFVDRIFVAILNTPFVRQDWGNLVAENWFVRLDGVQNIASAQDTTFSGLRDDVDGSGVQNTAFNSDPAVEISFSRVQNTAFSVSALETTFSGDEDENDVDDEVDGSEDEEEPGVDEEEPQVDEEEYLSDDDEEEEIAVLEEDSDNAEDGPGSGSNASEDSPDEEEDEENVAGADGYSSNDESDTDGSDVGYAEENQGDGAMEYQYDNDDGNDGYDSADGEDEDEDEGDAADGMEYTYAQEEEVYTAYEGGEAEYTYGEEEEVYPAYEGGEAEYTYGEEEEVYPAYEGGEAEYTYGQEEVYEAYEGAGEEEDWGYEADGGYSQDDYIE
ncbi:hypothetical protein B0H19DRAFT_61328 [Mycena capillaripes]|nr:hypothetical protein B0H19DRAFT_61328 [Mycena capillaripes]